MSPKSFLRKPQRKRKSSKKLLFVAGGIVLLVSVLSGSVAYILYAQRNVVSPLPPGIRSVLHVKTRSGEDELKALLAAKKISYREIASTYDGYVISLNSKQQVIVGKKQDLSRQISSLQIILPRLTMEGKQFKSIDLRYNKPVVVY